MAFLFAIEGIDGAGKGTLTRAFQKHAVERGYKAETLSFPRYQETAFSGLIANYLNGDYGPKDRLPAKFIALLYAGDRFESIGHLARLQQDTDLLILDRYVASNLAYAAAKVPRAQQKDIIHWILSLEMTQFQLPEAALTCLVSTDVVQANAMVLQKDTRSYTDRSRDLHEDDGDYLARVRQVYQQLCSENIGSSWFSLNPLQEDGKLTPPELLADRLWQELTARHPDRFSNPDAPPDR